MIENKELYSYIVHSLDIMNRSIVVNEQNTVKLFSYIYNNQSIFQSNIKDLNDKQNKVDLSVNKLNKDIKRINDLEKCVITFDNTIHKLEEHIKILEKKINDQNSNIIEVPVIIEEKSFKLFCIHIKEKIILYAKFIKAKVIELYDKVYKYIFRKKIQKRLEEEQKQKEEMLRKQQELEDKIRKQKIKEILNRHK